MMIFEPFKGHPIGPIGGSNPCFELSTRACEATPLPTAPSHQMYIFPFHVAPPMHQCHARCSLPIDPNPILTPPNIYAMGLHDTAADDIFLMVCILINWRKRPKENKEKDHRRDYFNHSLVILFQYLLPNF